MPRQPTYYGPIKIAPDFSAPPASAPTLSKPIDTTVHTQFVKPDDSIIPPADYHGFYVPPADDAGSETRNKPAFHLLHHAGQKGIGVRIDIDGNGNRAAHLTLRGRDADPAMGIASRALFKLIPQP